MKLAILSNSPAHQHCSCLKSITAFYRAELLEFWLPERLPWLTVGWAQMELWEDGHEHSMDSQQK